MEAEGTVEIKFKWKDQVKAMHRLDPELKDILRQMNNPWWRRLQRPRKSRVRSSCS